MSDPEFPWLGILIASPVIGIWYWCTDQYIVQRTLAAKDLTNARRGAIWGAFLKVWPVLIFLVPGLIGWALHQKGLLAIPPKTDGSGIDGDMVFPLMVTQLLPIGLRGLVVAGLLSALMSSLASMFNSCATLFTVDIYEKLRPGGHLLLGHSESLINLSSSFELRHLRNDLVYRRPLAGASPPDRWHGAAAAAIERCGDGEDER